MRLPLRVLLAVIGAIAVVAVPVHSGEPSPRFKEARIPHQDRSGRATVVEIDPRVPGAKQFLAATPEPIPSPGELVTPPRATPLSSPPPVPGRGY